MHLAYSAINTTHNSGPQSVDSIQHQNNNELMLRYQAYQTACNKYSNEIAAIQKYIPGWLPKFR
jgi:hypothetical protein